MHRGQHWVGNRMCRTMQGPSLFVRAAFSLELHVLVIYKRGRVGASLDLGSTHSRAQEWLASNELVVTVGASVWSIRDANEIVKVQLEKTNTKEDKTVEFTE